MRHERRRRHLPETAPIADDVDVERLATQFEITGGLIKNAVLSAVAAAVYEAGGDHAAVSRLVGGMRLFEDIRAEEQNGINVSAIKAALRMMGHDCGAARPPAGWPLDSGQLERLGGFLRQAGLCGDARP